MGWISCARCEKFWRNFVACTFALIAPVQPVLHRFSFNNEIVPNAPKLYETQQHMSLGSNRVHLVRLLQKFRCNFAARTFALIVLVRPILHRVSCSKTMIPNAPKHYETHENMSLGFNWVDRVRSFWKNLTRLHGTNLCINSTFSARIASSFRHSRKNPKCTQTLQNAPKHEWIGCIHCEKFQHDFVAQPFALIAPVQLVLHQVSCSNEIIPNAPKHYETDENMS